MLEKGRVDAIVQVCAMDNNYPIETKSEVIGFTNFEALYPLIFRILLMWCLVNVLLTSIGSWRSALLLYRAILIKRLFTVVTSLSIRALLAN